MYLPLVYPSGFLFLYCRHILEYFYYFYFSCSCKNPIWSCSREIILLVLLLGSCEWDLVLCLSEVKSSFLNKFISAKNNSFCWFRNSSVCTFNVSVKLLLKSSISLFMLLLFWVQTLEIELCLGIDRHVQLEIILHFTFVMWV